jgi:uncharacterized protein (DUF169 family)
MDWTEVARDLTNTLGLAHPPLAISFHSGPPPGVPAFDAPMSDPTPDGRTGRLPASCVFWMHASANRFSTVAADHGNCSVGRFTHGFATAEDIIDKDDVATLLDVGWVTMDAFAEVPQVERPPGAIVYGPLAGADEPDIVFLRLDARQLMELADAVPDLAVTGKPQCQIIPRALDRGEVAASLGCALSRARTGMGDDEHTCAIPAWRVGEILRRLTAVRSADLAVTGYAVEDARRFR